VSQDKEVTRILLELSDGKPGAAAELLERVYQELRGLARRKMRGQPRDHTLQPTALIHEAYLRLLGGGTPQWADRGHFFAAAAAAMRSILVDHARARSAQKRGGGRRRVSFSEAADPSTDHAADVLAVHESLEKLAALDPRKSATVELLFFGGLTVEEAAAVLGSSPRTVKRDWRFARAWLLQEIEK